MKSIKLLLLGLFVAAGTGSAFADDEDSSTDTLGDLKGSDRVDKKDAKVDRANLNVFEKDRFFIDKVDTASTEESTLFQGNLSSSTFFYSESSEPIAAAQGDVTGSSTSRLYTELRTQLDARHIGGGRWQARVDVRGRLVTNPEDFTKVASSDDLQSQSGLTGDSELDVRELWVTRPGDRFDVFVGRQFVPDLGALKIDGLRIDYAKSDRVTLLGFAGAYPLRGSRSIDTDYPVLKRGDGTELGRTPPIAAGAGAAYRTTLSYGSFGGGTIAPLKGEKPRVFVTSTGYLRSSPRFDFYHFALIDVVGEGGFSANNLSAGINFRPSPSLRTTLSINQVSTETLDVQAKAFLDANDAFVVNNEAQIRRISSSQAQAGVSASLGQAQEVEVSVAVAGRYRPDIEVRSNTGTSTFTSSTSVEVLAQAVHRNIKRTRLGADFARSFSVGDASSRSSYLSLRAFASREFRQGRGSWEADFGYFNTRDDGMGSAFTFGKSTTSTIAVNGTVYYRVGPSLFAMASAGFGRFNLKSGDTADPGVTQLSGFLRAAYRF